MVKEDVPNDLLIQYALTIIKRPQSERSEEELGILMKYSENLDFFQNMNKKQINIQMKTHEKCCSRMEYDQVKKGNAVFMAGDLPEKFYIILKGSVNVLLPISEEQLNQQAEEEDKKLKALPIQQKRNSIIYRISTLKEKMSSRTSLKSALKGNIEEGRVD